MAVSRRPNLFLVGGARCGTTAMHTYLGQHPDIFMSPLKEPNYFCPEFKWRRGTRDVMEGVGGDEAAYLRLFAGASDEKWRGESSVAYMRGPSAPRLIKDFAPDARILIMLRRPLDVVVSMHQYSVFYGMEPRFYDVNEAIRADVSFDPANPPAHFGPAYCETPLYAEQVERYFLTFGRENVHVTIYDDLRADARAAYAAILEFLGVDTQFMPNLNERVNVSRRLRSAALHHLYMPVWPLLRRNRLTRRVLRKLRLLNSYVGPPPRLDAMLEQQLTERYRPDIEHLSKLLDRDLTHWNQLQA